MSAEVRWLLSLVFVIKVFCAYATPPHGKFEYKYSFKPPYLAQKDGSVPFWTYGGNAIASSENVRLAPSMKSQKGGMWTKAKTNFDWWEVDILFRITGRGRIGADGLAFWYTDNQGAYDGQVFGSSDRWRGLGIFFDSFDNDNKHNNPYIMAVVNDGTRDFDHQNDGGAEALGGCLRDFRNKPYPTRAKVEYYMNTLTVLFHNGMTNNDKDFELCLRVENVHLPKQGFFGISAATGGLADDHDVLHFLTTSLWMPGVGPQTGTAQHAKVSPEEETKLSQEYAEYQRRLDHQREEYKKEHPGAGKDQEGDFDEWYESDSQRELRQIFTGQSQIMSQVKTLGSKLDEVIGRQENTLSMVTAIQQGGVVQRAPQQGMPMQQQPMMIDTIKRHEVDMLMNNLNMLSTMVREISGMMGEVNSRLEAVAHARTGAVIGGDSASAGALHEVREALKSLQRDNASKDSKDCATSCISLVTMGIVSFIQLIVILGYFFWRDRQEHQYKKFY